MLLGWVRSGRGGRAARCHRIRPTTTLDITRGLQTDSRKKEPYAATLKNLQIGSHTRVIVQGFTGRNATANSQESMEYGTNIVGGVVPHRKPGTPDAHLGRPLFPSVRAAVDAVRPDATAVYVPAHRAAAAIEEAIAAEVPLVVAVAEHIPVHDMVRVHQVLRTQDKSRLVGPNSPGLLNVNAACRIGFQPLSVYAPGCVGLVAKSGTLSYEAAAATTRAGLGQSLCVGVGGDVLPGTDLDEALAAVLADGATRAVALMGELGGDAEVRAAVWLEEYYRGQAARGEARKPVAFLLAGYDAPRDRVMGHAGAFWQPGDPTLEFKYTVLQNAGAIPVHHPSEFGSVLASLLRGDAATPASSSSSQQPAPSHRNGLQSRSSRTKASPFFSPPARGNTDRARFTTCITQARHLHLDAASAMRIWHEPLEGDLQSGRVKKDNDDDGITTTRNFVPTRRHHHHQQPHYLALGIDRHTRDWCFRACPAWSPDKPHDAYTKITFPHLPLHPLPARILLHLAGNGGRSSSSSPDDVADAAVAAIAAAAMRLSFRVSDSFPHIAEGILEALGWEGQSSREHYNEIFWNRDHLGFHMGLWRMMNLVETYAAKSVAIQFFCLPRPPPPPPLCPRQENDHPLLDVVDVAIDLDDAAYRSGGSESNKGRRSLQPEQHNTYAAAAAALQISSPAPSVTTPGGLVYHRLASSFPPRLVGIVVNGAGLALNTLDELARRGVPAANFLDTGGLATSATVAEALSLVLQHDPDIRVLFVNVFGGLTRGEMIARGILQALQQQQGGRLLPPLVVRIQGTGAEQGLQLLRKEEAKAAAADTRQRPSPGSLSSSSSSSRPKLFVYAGFHEALDKVKELVQIGGLQESSAAAAAAAAAAKKQSLP